MKNLRVLFLFVLSVTVLSCENPFFKTLLDKEDSVKPSLNTAGQGNTQTPLEPPPAPPPSGPGIFSFKTENTSVTLKVQTSDNSALKVEGASVTSIPGNGSEQTISGITSGTLVTVKAEEGVKIIKLYCGNNKITELNVQGCTALTYLYCNNNKLTSLNVQGYTALRELHCSDNQLSSLNVQGCTALTYLYCNNNQLTSLNVQGCTALTYLYCRDNKLTSLNVQGCTALMYLYCNNNQLNSLNVQGLTALREVGCYNNKITSLNVQDCTALEWLSCYNNKLNEEAFILLFTDLPSRSSYAIKGTCHLYREADPAEGNCTDFTLSPALQAAFNNAKAKNWKMYKFIDSVGAEI